ncbi:hypothetical protein ACRAKI_16805 [Saccharothrix isguenensis]
MKNWQALVRVNVGPSAEKFTPSVLWEKRGYTVGAGSDVGVDP